MMAIVSVVLFGWLLSAICSYDDFMAIREVAKWIDRERDNVDLYKQ